MANSSEAARKSILAGMDVDMMGFDFDENLEQLVTSGAVSMETLDNAVKHVLTMKYELGLFDNPYKYCNETRETEEVLTAANI